jgi:hypothetical protein
MGNACIEMHHYVLAYGSFLRKLLRQGALVHAVVDAVAMAQHDLLQQLEARLLPLKQKVGKAQAVMSQHARLVQQDIARRLHWLGSRQS